MSAVHPRRLDAETERATRAFMQRLEGQYLVIEAILYGSRARGVLHRPRALHYGERGACQADRAR